MQRILICYAALWTLTVSAAGRPNILFLFSDDHAIKAISAYSGLWRRWRRLRILIGWEGGCF